MDKNFPREIVSLGFVVGAAVGFNAVGATMGPAVGASVSRIYRRSSRRWESRSSKLGVEVGNIKGNFVG